MIGSDQLTRDLCLYQTFGPDIVTRAQDLGLWVVEGNRDSTNTHPSQNLVTRPLGDFIAPGDQRPGVRPYWVIEQINHSYRDLTRINCSGPIPTHTPFMASNLPIPTPPGVSINALNDAPAQSLTSAPEGTFGGSSPDTPDTIPGQIF